MMHLSKYLVSLRHLYEEKHQCTHVHYADWPLLQS